MGDDSNNCSNYLFPCWDHCDQEQSSRFELFNDFSSSDWGTREVIICARCSNHESYHRGLYLPAQIWQPYIIGRQNVHKFSYFKNPKAPLIRQAKTPSLVQHNEKLPVRFFLISYYCIGIVVMQAGYGICENYEYNSRVSVNSISAEFSINTVYPRCTLKEVRTSI